MVEEALGCPVIILNKSQRELVIFSENYQHQPKQMIPFPTLLLNYKFILHFIYLSKCIKFNRNDSNNNKKYIILILPLYMNGISNSFNIIKILYKKLLFG